MASEIRVNKIENRSGLGTVTFADTGVDLAGIVTATTFSGSGASLTNLPAANVTGTLPAISGANLTNLPAANLTGALPAISGANLTGIAATDNVRTGILDVAGISTFRNTMNVGAAVTISESGIEASGIGITVANINGAQLGGRRNLIINGAMNIAQRGTSSTTAGYETVDRFYCGHSGTDEAPTFAQADVASGTSPYAEGFRKCLKITNGNQTSGAGGADEMNVLYNIEAQDVNHSGWNYSSTSSFATLSFWIRSSVAQTFYGYMRSYDNTATGYAFETGSLSANTWTKIIRTFPGNSGLNIDNDTGTGIQIRLLAYIGTSYTDNSTSTNVWATYNSSARTPDNVSTWYTTNDATLELTGFQFEVGSQATPFEHRSVAEELSLCERYYQIIMESGTGGGGQTGGVGGTPYTNSSSVYCPILFRCRMRAEPTLESTASSTFRTRFGNSANFNGFSGFNDAGDHSATIITNGNAGGGNVGQYIWVETNDGAKVALDAELS